MKFPLEFFFKFNSKEKERFTSCLYTYLSYVLFQNTMENYLIRSNFFLLLQIAIQFHHPVTSPSDSTPPDSNPLLTSSTNSTLSFSILNDAQIEFSVKSLVGHRTKVKDLPKLTKLITEKLKSWLLKEVIWPKRKEIVLSSGWGNECQVGGGEVRGGNPFSTSSSPSCLSSASDLESELDTADHED